MINLAIALGSGLVVFAGLFFSKILSAAEATLPAGLVIVITYFVIARKTFAKVEKIFGEAAQALGSMPPKFDLGIATLEKAYAYASRQIGVRSQVDTQIGVVYFLQKEFAKAQPYLQRSLGFGHWLGGAMLGVIYYKKKNHAEMKKTFDVVTKRAGKQGLVWCLYAYLLSQIGEKSEAMKVLLDGSKKAKDDERVKENLLALQNDKKIKMKGYKEQWYQFHLESPPMDMGQAPMHMRMSKAARRGRW